VEPQRPSREPRLLRRPRARGCAIASGHLSSDQPLLAEHGLQETREALFDLIAPEGVELAVALLALIDETGFAQDAEMMGRGRLRDAQVEAAAWHLALARQTPHDAAPNGVGERMQDGGKIELRRARVRQRLHVSPLPGLFDNSRTTLYDDHRTYVRESSYMKEGFVDHSGHSYLGSRPDRRFALHDHAGQPDRALDPAVDAARSRRVP